MNIDVYKRQVDIMMHTMERYFNHCDNMELTDGISEHLLPLCASFIPHASNTAPAHRAPSGVCEFDLKDGELL